MKLNSSVKYHLHGFKTAALIFYLVMAAMIALSVMLNRFLGGEGNFGGIAAASIIFLFIMGICSFYSEFKMLNQNGVSRHQQWKSFIISSLIIGCIMSAIDLIVLFLSSFIIDTRSLIIALSSNYINNTVLQVINAYFLQILFYTLALNVGYLIRLIYYRMNKFGVITVSICIPGFFFIALPILSSHFNLEPFFGAFFSFLGEMMSPDKFYGLPGMYLFFIALFALIAVLNRLLIKKAIIK